MHGKSVPVHGEDLPDAFALCHSKERGISQVHGTVGVLAHEFPDSGNIPGIKRKELQGSAFQHFPKGLLSARLASQQVHSFSQWGPHCSHWLAKCFQRRDAPGMVLVVRVDQCHERPGID